jgi:hypothetical protein
MHANTYINLNINGHDGCHRHFIARDSGFHLALLVNPVYFDVARQARDPSAGPWCGFTGSMWFGGDGVGTKYASYGFTEPPLQRRLDPEANPSIPTTIVSRAGQP